MMKIKRQNKLRTYLAVTAGVGCAASVAEGAVVFYGVNGANDTNEDPIGINLGFLSSYTGSGYVIDDTSSSASIVNIGLNSVLFTQGADLAISGNRNSYARYHGYGSFQRGAELGDQNYANIDFDRDAVYEAVAQFYFDGAGGGYLIAIATTNDINDPQDLSSVGGPALSISAGKALIDAAAVPEPSSIALLALGSAGLLARRKRQVAA